MDCDLPPHLLGDSSFKYAPVSSVYLIKCLFGNVLVHEFVHKINSKGDETHPCEEPVYVIIVSDKKRAYSDLLDFTTKKVHDLIYNIQFFGQYFCLWHYGTKSR